MFLRCFFASVLVICTLMCDAIQGNLLADIDRCRPQQVHLSYGESTAVVIVMWSTDGPCSTSVLHGTEPFRHDKITPGESRLFSEPWNKQGTKYIHHVKLRDLTSGTTFFYQPTSNDVSVGPYAFKTPPFHTDTGDVATEFLTIGDLKTSSPMFVKLKQEVEKGNYSAIIQPGNMAMNLSGDGGKNGDNFLKMMEPILKTVPYLTAPGPAESDNGTFSSYQHRFSMPKTEWPMSIDQTMYSIDIGLVHVVSYSTEVLFANGGKYATQQHNSLLADLKVADQNRQKVPWIVAFGHHPMYCASEDPALACNKENSKTAKAYEDIMYHYGVDLIISSYGKGFEVSYPMYKGVKVSDNYTHPMAPVHVTIGSASTWKAEHNFTNDDWLNYLNEDETPLCFSRIRVYNSSLLQFEIVSSENFNVVESFKLVQPEHKKFSIEELPSNISNEIHNKIQNSGGKPGVMNIAEITSPKPVSTISKKIDEILHGDNRNKIIIGVSVAGAILLIFIAILIVRRVLRGRRRHSSRRWENMDINYGKRYYNKAPEKDDMDNDFEIDMTDTTPSRKLLSDD